MSERLWGILVDSFGKILLPGLTVTIPLTAISFTLALIIAVAVALVQFAHVPVLQRLARFYIWGKVIDLIKERPWTGYGIENLMEPFGEKFGNESVSQRLGFACRDCPPLWLKICS